MNRPVAALSRRGLMTAAAAAGAVVATAHLARVDDAAPSATPLPGAKPAGAEGYRLTEHIKRYYQTTRV
jgi:hypothetical protein